MSAPYPHDEEVVGESREIAGAHPEPAATSEVGECEEGRPMPLLTITDPAVRTENRSVFPLRFGARIP